MTDVEKQALRHSCPYCRAPRRAWCVTVNGPEADMLHHDRLMRGAREFNAKELSRRGTE